MNLRRTGTCLVLGGFWLCMTVTSADACWRCWHRQHYEPHYAGTSYRPSTTPQQGTQNGSGRDPLFGSATGEKATEGSPDKDKKVTAPVAAGLTAANVQEMIDSSLKSSLNTLQAELRVQLANLRADLVDTITDHRLERLRERAGHIPGYAEPVRAPGRDDHLESIKRLSEMQKDGVLTADEFNQLKKKLLEKLVE